MNFELKALALPQAANQPADVLVLLVPDAFEPGSDALSTLVAHARKNKDWDCEAGKLLQLYQVPAIAARRVVLLGVGNGSAKAVRQAVVACAAVLKGPGVVQALLCFAAPPVPQSVAAAVQALREACYVYTATKPQAKAVSLAHVVLAVAEEQPVRAAFEAAQAVAAGVALAREWANRPANHATPTRLAEVAQELAQAPRMRCKVRGPSEVQELGMGAFLAVARGSREPLRFIELRYQGADKSHAPVVLVGKGITFDAGGISLKPAPEMDEMKFDMGGAASVLGVFQALALLQPAINVVGLIPACENLPDGRAVKPGDVVTSMAGQTIEILNTDAEGRLVLCDALTYAARFEPAALIDVATLTGACVIALGGVRSGMFASDETLASALLAAGEAALDPCWRMPLDEEYGEGLKSTFADVANVAGRAAGVVTAAKFLQRFVGTTPWAHLDIAGTAWKSGAAKGATGRPVALLVHYLLDRAAAVGADLAPIKLAKEKKPGKKKAVLPDVSGVTEVTPGQGV